MDGATFSGEGRSKKQAKLVAAKNALSTLLAQNQQQQQLLAPFPTIEFNRGVVEVDFTSDDPTDANFIINEMNRIQTTSNQMFPDAQMPLTAATTPTTTGPLSVLPGNNMNGNGATMRPPSIKAGNAKNEAEVEVIVESGKEESIHDDSGHGADVVDVEMDAQDEEPMEEDYDDDEEEEETSADEEEEGKGDVEITPEILEIIRISVEHYIDYDLEIQRK